MFLRFTELRRLFLKNFSRPMSFLEVERGGREGGREGVKK